MGKGGETYSGLGVGVGPVGTTSAESYAPLQDEEPDMGLLRFCQQNSWCRLE